MKQWATIVEGRVYRVFEKPDAFVPEFGPPLNVVEITALSPQPTAGWNYDKRTDTFTPRTRPIPPADDDIGDALALVDTTGPFLADQVADALRLILRKLFGV